MKTHTNEILKISSNKSKRTFTIWTKYAKYRTLPFTKVEFREADLFWTDNDWKQFLRTNNYYNVK